MAEITIPLSAFKKIAKEYDPVKVFESADAVALPFGSHLLRAYKTSDRKIYQGNRAVPMLAIGYSGISSWEMHPLGKRRKNGDK